MAIELPELLVPDAAAWHTWLDEHHATSSGVWLVLTRKGGTTTSLSYDQALEECLCFGWIDGQIRRRDDQTTFQRTTPRTARSRWSARNVAHAERLAAEGRMAPAGRAAVEAARADGRWDAAYAGAASYEMPVELLDAIARDPAAQATYDALTAQNRYALYHRLTSVRGEATRRRRIEQFVAMLGRGEAPHPQRLPPRRPDAAGQ